MADKNPRRAGRRPRRATPMARSAFSAFAEQHIFLMLQSRNSEMSDGLRTTITQLVKQDEEAAATMKQALAMVALAKNELGEDATQDEVVAHIKANWLRLVENG